MIQLVIVSTAAEAVAICAALDGGPPAGTRRIMVVASDAPIPESRPRLDQMAGFEVLAGRCTEVIGWDEEIAPLHPAGWMPSREELPVFERLLRRGWGIGPEAVELVVGSVTDGPARSLAVIFHDALLTVCCPDLTAYGPTMNHLPMGVGSRITRLLHLDLVPGLRPLLLGEYRLPIDVVPATAYRAVVDELAAAIEPCLPPGLPRAADGRTAIVLAGPDADPAVLREVAARNVLFVPPPGGLPGAVRRFRPEAERLGVRFAVAPELVPAEVWFAKTRPDLVVGVGSTELFTAARLYGLAVAAHGGSALAKLTPYESRDRIPLTIADALLPTLTAGTDLAPLVGAIAYCMRAPVRAELRTAAAEFLRAADAEVISRYFDPDRLAALGLPGAPPLPPPPVVPLPPEPAQLTRRRSVGRRIHRAFRRPDVKQRTHE